MMTQSGGSYAIESRMGLLLSGWLIVALWFGAVLGHLLVVMITICMLASALWIVRRQEPAARRADASGGRRRG